MDFALPEIGEGVYEAELIRWLIEPGATVKRGQALAEVMTDKATMEVPSPLAGGSRCVPGDDDPKRPTRSRFRLGRLARQGGPLRAATGPQARY